MKKIDLNFCIDAKNEYEQLDMPCDCYRYYTFAAFNMEVYRISYCKHWKDYIISDYEARTKEYRAQRLTSEFISRVLWAADISHYEPHFISDVYYPNRQNTFKNIEKGEIYFYEPVCLDHRMWLYHKIKAIDVLKILDERFDLNEKGTSRWLMTSSWSHPSMYDEFKDDEIRNKSYYRLNDAYLDRLNDFFEVLMEINKKMQGRKYVPLLDTAHSILKYKIKFKKNQNNEQKRQERQSSDCSEVGTHAS